MFSMIPVYHSFPEKSLSILYDFLIKFLILSYTVVNKGAAPKNPLCGAYIPHRKLRTVLLYMKKGILSRNAAVCQKS